MTTIAQHSQGSVVAIAWKDQDGNIKPLTGVSSIKGVLRSGSGPSSYTDTTIVGAIAATDEANGLSEWTLHVDDTDATGKFQLFLFANYIGGRVDPTLAHNIEIASTPTPPV